MIERSLNTKKCSRTFYSIIFQLLGWKCVFVFGVWGWGEIHWIWFWACWLERGPGAKASITHSGYTRSACRQLPLTLVHWWCARHWFPSRRWFTASVRHISNTTVASFHYNFIVTISWLTKWRPWCIFTVDEITMRHAPGCSLSLLSSLLFTA